MARPTVARPTVLLVGAAVVRVLQRTLLVLADVLIHHATLAIIHLTLLDPDAAATNLFTLAVLRATLVIVGAGVVLHFTLVRTDAVEVRRLHHDTLVLLPRPLPLLSAAQVHHFPLVPRLLAGGIVLLRLGAPHLLARGRLLIRSVLASRRGAPALSP